jgi:ABC-2 type transport system permease protein
LILVGAIQGMNLGISIISKETREKTADFLLTKPVTRTQIITSKLLAAILSLLITAIIYIATALIMASIVKTENYSIKVFLLISLSLFFIQLLFLSLGILVATVFPKIKSVIAVSLGIVFMFYFIGMLSGSSGEELTRYFSTFKYFDPAAITKTGSYEVSFVFAWIVMILLSIGVSYFTYKKKDIHTV